MGRLEILVIEARRVANIQKIGEIDPYVKVKYGLEDKTRLRYKTKVVDNSVNPVWKEMFIFQIADENTAQIRFEVWNDNVMVDDLLGYYNFSVNGLERGVVLDTWAPLQGCRVSTAELHLKVLAVDFGATPPPGTVTVKSIANMADVVKTEAEAEQENDATPQPESSASANATQGNTIDIHIQGPAYNQPQQPLPGYLPQGYPPQPGLDIRLKDIHHSLATCLKGIHHSLDIRLKGIHHSLGIRLKDIHHSLGIRLKDIHLSLGTRLKDIHLSLGTRLKDIHHSLGPHHHSDRRGTFHLFNSFLTATSRLTRETSRTPLLPIILAPPGQTGGAVQRASQPMGRPVSPLLVSSYNWGTALGSHRSNHLEESNFKYMYVYIYIYIFIYLYLYIYMSLQRGVTTERQADELQRPRHNKQEYTLTGPAGQMMGSMHTTVNKVLSGGQSPPPVDSRVVYTKQTCGCTVSVSPSKPNNRQTNKQTNATAQTQKAVTERSSFKLEAGCEKAFVIKDKPKGALRHVSGNVPQHIREDSVYFIIYIYILNSFTIPAILIPSLVLFTSAFAATLLLLAFDCLALVFPPLCVSLELR
eukprot:gene9441-6624_t